MTEEKLKRLKELVGKITRYRHCMSYDGSYFTEPPGMLKRTTRELEILMDTLSPPSLDHVNQMAGDRYKVVPTSSGFSPHAVVAGNGTEELHKGHKSTCEEIQRLRSAFLVGAFAVINSDAVTETQSVESEEAPEPTRMLYVFTYPSADNCSYITTAFSKEQAIENIQKKMKKLNEEYRAKYSGTEDKYYFDPEQYSIEVIPLDDVSMQFIEN